jgi:hypothetical protein
MDPARDDHVPEAEIGRGDTARDADHERPVRIQVLQQITRYVLGRAIPLLDAAHDGDEVGFSVGKLDSPEVVLMLSTDEFDFGLGKELEYRIELLLKDRDDAEIDLPFELRELHRWLLPGSWRVA